MIIRINKEIEKKIKEQNLSNFEINIILYNHFNEANKNEKNEKRRNRNFKK